MIKAIVIMYICMHVVVAGEVSIGKLIPALVHVESNGDTHAIGDSGNALGCLQIWACVVQDVNRVSNTTIQHSDVYDRDIAEYCCYVYLWHYGRAYTRRTGKTPTYEVYARMWNGGPKGYSKEATKAYWSKVKKQLTITGRTST